MILTLTPPPFVMYAGRIFLVLLASVTVVGCEPFPDLCGNEIVQELAAPNGRYKAILFERDCGATTGFTSQVSILTAAEKLEGSGNTFVADDGHSAAPSAEWGGPWVELQWQSRNQLLITYDDRARVFKTETRVGGVKVVYETR